MVPRRGDKKLPWFSAWARVYQPQDKGRRSVLIAVTPWGALSPSYGWPLPVKDGRPVFTVAEVVQFLSAYSRRVATPLSSTAVTGQELMTALRPPTRPWRDETSGKVRPAWVPDALHLPVDPAPCEAPPRHPLTVGRDHTDPAQTLLEEALQWWRMPTDAERRLPYIVSLDINLAFGAAANKLQVGTCAPYHLQRVPFDKKLPGSWLYDLSGVPMPDGMPSPFTPTGAHPTGPAWYETHTIAYAVELGFRPPPAAEAWVRPNEAQAKRLGLAPHPAPALDEGLRRRLPKDPPPAFGNAPYLTPWYNHLRDAYMDTYEALGIGEALAPQEFLAAMEQLNDPAFREENATELQVLSAIKTTFKGAIGKLRERDHRTGRRTEGSRWPALSRPTWRPDIRAAIIARSRVNMHRKIVATAAATGAVPLAIRTDCLLYASATPDMLWLTGHRSGFQLGCNPGYVKPEPFYYDQAFHHHQTMDWYLHWAEQGKNPASEMKDKTMPRDSAAALDGGE
ncbi:hypothetical protein [Actinacidiphila glaucinigra]|uniref:hypothetical protein n=1 Tax=Actinacidiphila glaucinigra TaxID=235986 RepID=UPI0035D82781